MKISILIDSKTAKAIFLILVVTMLLGLVNKAEAAPLPTPTASPWYCKYYPNASGCWTPRYFVWSKTCLTQYLCYVWTSRRRLRVTLYAHDLVVPGQYHRFYGPNWWGAYTNVK